MNNTPKDKSNVGDVLRELISEDGHILTNYVIVTSAVHSDSDDSTAYSYITPNGQPMHTTLGLIEMGRKWYQPECRDENG